MDSPPTFRKFCSAVYQLWSDTVTGSRSASFVILAAILGVVSIVFAASLEKNLWLKILIGATPTFTFFLAAFIYAIFSLWKNQRHQIITLSAKLSPRLQLDFDQNSDGIVLTPIKVYSLDEQGRQIVIDSHGAYVRIRLTALSEPPLGGVLLS